MSKVDAQRPMREAKYAARHRARSPREEGAPEPGGAAAVKPAQPTRATPTRAELTAAPQGGGRCGHKSMNGRECTREAGHAEKSHRYG